MRIRCRKVTISDRRLSLGTAELDSSRKQRNRTCLAVAKSITRTLPVAIASSLVLLLVYLPHRQWSFVLAKGDMASSAAIKRSLSFVVGRSGQRSFASLPWSSSPLLSRERENGFLPHASSSGFETASTSMQQQRDRLRSDLETYRSERSLSLRKSAFVILPDKVMDGICALDPLPLTMDDLAKVKGLGAKKLQLFGTDILDLVLVSSSSPADATVAKGIAKTEVKRDRFNQSRSQEAQAPPQKIQVRFLGTNSTSSAAEDETSVEINNDNDTEDNEIPIPIVTGNSNTEALQPQERQQTLQQCLEEYRSKQSKHLGKSPSLILSDVVIQRICSLDPPPTTREDLLTVKGLGAKKVELFGDEILSLVSSYAKISGGEGGTSSTTIESPMDASSNSDNSATNIDSGIESSASSYASPDSAFDPTPSSKPLARDAGDAIAFSEELGGPSRRSIVPDIETNDASSSSFSLDSYVAPAPYSAPEGKTGVPALDSYVAPAPYSAPKGDTGVPALDSYVAPAPYSAPKGYTGVPALDSYVAPAPYSYGEEEDEEEDFGINEESFGTVSSTSSKEYSEEGNEETTTEKPKKLRKTQLKKDLKEYRMSQKKDGEAAYTVFTNAALEGIYASLPMTESELLEVKGIGPKKLELYGDDILALVAPYVGMGGRQRDLDEASSDTDTPIQPEIIAPESLTDEQRRAAGLIFGNDNEEEGRRKNVFVTGSAGTGKSHLLKYVVEILQGRQNYPGDGIYYATDFKVGVCAPTGVAAVIVGGSTLHSFFGIGLGTGSKSSILQKVYRNAGAKTRIDETDVLIIDECSMLSSDLLETLDMVARTVRKEGIFSEEPFGGMQVIAFGDFFQLPPVYRYDGSHDRRWRPFCFDSPVWTELGLSENIVELKEVQRQEEGDFVNLLSKVRNGSVVRKDIEDLNRKCLVGPNNPLPNDGILPTRLYVLNRDVDLENTTRLRELDGKEVVCKAKDVWRQKMPFGTPAAVKKKMKEGLDLQMPEEIRLKIGAQVMLTRNKDLDRNLVNGSRGVVERFERGRDGNSIPIVRFDSGLITRIDPVESALYNTSGGEGCLVRMQVPLKLAWAITIHKSQGSTLTRASLDIASAFEYGQCYVALSRVRSLDGLWLERPAELRNVMVSPQVVDFLSRE